MTATNPNDQAVSLVPSAEAVVRPQTAGQLLREARLKAGVHLAVLSVTLKVPVRQLEALEADQLDLAKGAVFLRGLASSVCRHLNTDPAPILALLPQPTGQLEPYRSPTGPSVPERTLKVHGPGLRRLQSSRVFWGSALMLMVIGALVWMPGPAQWSWVHGVQAMMADITAPSKPEAVATTDTLMPPPAAQVTTPSDGAMVGAPMSPMVSVAPSPAAATAALPASAAQAKAAASAAATPPVATAGSATATGPTSEWVFAARDDSWLEMRNAQKAVVWMGVLKAGETTRIQSPIPVSVVIGRAQAVNVTLRGQPFDLKPHTQVTVARFEVKE